MKAHPSWSVLSIGIKVTKDTVKDVMSKLKHIVTYNPSLDDPRIKSIWVKVYDNDLETPMYWSWYHDHTVLDREVLVDTPDEFEAELVKLKLQGNEDNV